MRALSERSESKDLSSSLQHLTSVFSFTSALFWATAQRNSFLINYFRTLSRATGGGGANQTSSHRVPYILPSSVWANPFVSRSYETTGGGLCFPIRNVSLSGFAASSELHQAIHRIAEDEHGQGQRGVLLVGDNRANQKQNRGHQRNSGEPGVAPGAVRARHVRLALAQHKNGRVGERVVCHEEKGEHGGDALESISAQEGNKQEQHADDGAEQKRNRRRPAGVDLRCGAEEEPVAAHRIERARAEKLVGVEAAQHRDDHDGADDRIAQAAKHAIGNRAEDERIPRDFVDGHDVQRNEIEEEVNPHNGKNTAENGARNVAAGIAHLFAEIDDAVPAVDGVNDGLESQHDGNRKRPARRQGKAGSAGLHCGFMRRAAQKKSGCDENHEGAGLQHSRQELRVASPANPAPLQHAKAENDRDRETLHAPGENREEVAAVIADDDGDGRSGAASGEPVAPADDEAGVIA